MQEMGLVGDNTNHRKCLKVKAESLKPKNGWWQHQPQGNSISIMNLLT